MRTEEHIHKWGHRPPRRDVLAVWRAAKDLGDIPRSWSFVRHGEVRQVWGGFALMARA